MKPMLLSFPAQGELARTLAAELDAMLGRLDWRRFPDGESLVAVDEAVAGREVAILASLRDPDTLTVALRLAADAARELGARRVGLVAPYLAYMRQDRRFHPGEAVSARSYARLLAQGFDWLVTIDPHLHRIASLAEVFPIPTRCVASAPLVADWIASNVPDAIVIGPDEESRQWAAAIAARAGVPVQVLRKIRRGDRQVEVSLPDAQAAQGRTAVIVDDIVASGHTAIATARHLRGLGLRVVCVAIHAVFAGDACQQLLAAGVERIVSTDAIVHPSNAIGTAGLLAPAVAELWAEPADGRCPTAAGSSPRSGAA